MRQVVEGFYRTLQDTQLSNGDAAKVILVRGDGDCGPRSIIGGIIWECVLSGDAQLRAQALEKFKAIYHDHISTNKLDVDNELVQQIEQIFKNMELIKDHASLQLFMRKYFPTLDATGDHPPTNDKVIDLLAGCLKADMAAKIESGYVENHAEDFEVKGFMDITDPVIRQYIAKEFNINLIVHAKGAASFVYGEHVSDKINIHIEFVDNNHYQVVVPKTEIDALKDEASAPEVQAGRPVATSITAEALAAELQRRERSKSAAPTATTAIPVHRRTQTEMGKLFAGLHIPTIPTRRESTDSNSAWEEEPKRSSIPTPEVLGSVSQPPASPPKKVEPDASGSELKSSASKPDSLSPEEIAANAKIAAKIASDIADGVIRNRKAHSTSFDSDDGGVFDPDNDKHAAHAAEEAARKIEEIKQKRAREHEQEEHRLKLAEETKANFAHRQKILDDHIAKREAPGAFVYDVVNYHEIMAQAEQFHAQFQDHENRGLLLERVDITSDAQQALKVVGDFALKTIDKIESFRRTQVGAGLDLSIYQKIKDLCGITRKLHVDAESHNQEIVSGHPIGEIHSDTEIDYEKRAEELLGALKPSKSDPKFLTLIDAVGHAYDAAITELSLAYEIRSYENDKRSTSFSEDTGSEVSEDKIQRYMEEEVSRKYDAESESKVESAPKEAAAAVPTTEAFARAPSLEDGSSMPRPRIRAISFADEYGKDLVHPHTDEESHVSDTESRRPSSAEEPTEIPVSSLEPEYAQSLDEATDAIKKQVLESINVADTMFGGYDSEESRTDYVVGQRYIELAEAQITQLQASILEIVPLVHDLTPRFKDKLLDSSATGPINEILQLLTQDLSSITDLKNHLGDLMALQGLYLTRLAVIAKLDSLDDELLKKVQVLLKFGVDAKRTAIVMQIALNNSEKQQAAAQVASIEAAPAPEATTVNNTFDNIEAIKSKAIEELHAKCGHVTTRITEAQRFKSAVDEQSALAAEQAIRNIHETVQEVVKTLTTSAQLFVLELSELKLPSEKLKSMSQIFNAVCTDVGSDPVYSTGSPSYALDDITTNLTPKLNAIHDVLHGKDKLILSHEIYNSLLVTIVAKTTELQIQEAIYKSSTPDLGAQPEKVSSVVERARQIIADSKSTVYSTFPIENKKRRDELLTTAKAVIKYVEKDRDLQVLEAGQISEQKICDYIKAIDFSTDVQPQQVLDKLTELEKEIKTEMVNEKMMIAVEAAKRAALFGVYFANNSKTTSAAHWSAVFNAEARVNSAPLVQHPEPQPVTAETVALFAGEQEAKVGLEGHFVSYLKETEQKPGTKALPKQIAYGEHLLMIAEALNFIINSRIKALPEFTGRTKNYYARVLRFEENVTELQQEAEVLRAALKENTGGDWQAANVNLQQAITEDNVDNIGFYRSYLARLEYGLGLIQSINNDVQIVRARVNILKGVSTESTVDNEATRRRATTIIEDDTYEEFLRQLEAEGEMPLGPKSGRRGTLVNLLRAAKVRKQQIVSGLDDVDDTQFLQRQTHTITLDAVKAQHKVENATNAMLANRKFRRNLAKNPIAVKEEYIGNADKIVMIALRAAQELVDAVLNPNDTRPDNFKQTFAAIVAIRHAVKNNPPDAREQIKAQLDHIENIRGGLNPVYKKCIIDMLHQACVTHFAVRSLEAEIERMENPVVGEGRKAGWFGTGAKSTVIPVSPEESDVDKENAANAGNTQAGGATSKSIFASLKNLLPGRAAAIRKAEAENLDAGHAGVLDPDDIFHAPIRSRTSTTTRDASVSERARSVATMSSATLEAASVAQQPQRRSSSSSSSNGSVGEAPVADEVPELTLPGSPASGPRRVPTPSDLGADLGAPLGKLSEADEDALALYEEAERERKSSDAGVSSVVSVDSRIASSSSSAAPGAALVVHRAGVEFSDFKQFAFKTFTATAPENFVAIEDSTVITSHSDFAFKEKATNEIIVRFSKPATPSPAPGTSAVASSKIAKGKGFEGARATLIAYKQFMEKPENKVHNKVYEIDIGDFNSLEKATQFLQAYYHVFAAGDAWGDNNVKLNFKDDNTKNLIGLVLCYERSDSTRIPLDRDSAKSDAMREMLKSHFGPNPSPVPKKPGWLTIGRGKPPAHIHGDEAKMQREREQAQRENPNYGTFSDADYKRFAASAKKLRPTI